MITTDYQARQETEVPLKTLLIEPGTEYSLSELLSNQEKGIPLFLSSVGNVPQIYIRFYEGRAAETGVGVIVIGYLGYADAAKEVELETSLYDEKGKRIFQGDAHTFGMAISIPASSLAEAKTISFHAKNTG